MRRLFGAAAIAVALLCASPAFAGSVKIHDNAGILDGSAKDAVTQAAEKSPFEVHVLTVSSAPSQADFERQVSASVTGTSVLSVGIEMQHHITTVMYGGATGVPQGNGKRLGDSARPFFRAGNFGQGIAAIIVGTAQMREAAPVVMDVPSATPGVPPQTVVVEANKQVAPPIEVEGGHPVLWTLFFVTLIGGFAWYFVAKRKREMEAYEQSLATDVIDRDEQWRWQATRSASPNAPAPVEREEPSYNPSLPVSVSNAPRITPAYRRSYTPSYSSRPSVSAPAPSTTVINNTTSGGNGDLATGILLGQALSRPSHDTYIERDVVREVPAPSYTPPAYDPPPAPSRSTSSWADSDSGSSSSSSWGSSSDSGSSSSSSSSWSDSSSSDSSSSWSSSDSSSSSSDSSSSSSDSGSW